MRSAVPRRSKQVTDEQYQMLVHLFLADTELTEYEQDLCAYYKGCGIPASTAAANIRIHRRDVPSARTAR